MKLLTYATSDNPQAENLGLYVESANAVLPLASLGYSFSSMNDLIDNAPPAQIEELKTIAANVSASGKAPEGTELVSYDTVVKRSPIPCPKQDVICLGINYAAHAEESARYKKEAFERNRQYAVYFSKRVNEAVPDGGVVPAHRDFTDRLDYESELAVVLGQDCRDVSAEDAYKYVFGYTILNDISAREVQTNHKQWYLGKSLEGFTPMGPWIVTADEIQAPPALAIRSYVNGELRQNSNTDLLMFSIGQIIEELSHAMLLKAGTIISTGTPAGVGMGFTPPNFLKEGDEVVCEIEGIGRLSNRII